MDYNEQIKNRVKRIEGQLRGILKMMEENKQLFFIKNFFRHIF